METVNQPHSENVPSKSVLIAYASQHGQVAKIADRVAEDLRRAGIEVALAALDKRTLNGSHIEPDALSPTRYDGVVVAASVHAGHYQRALTQWVTTHRDALAARPNLFLSVSLTAAEDDEEKHKALEPILEGFVRDTGWQPNQVEQVAGALAYRRYGFIVRWLMWWMMRKEGKPSDTHRDYEYTNWPQLDRLATAFAERV